MKKLSKEQLTQKEALGYELTTNSQAVYDAVDNFRTLMDEAWGKVQDAIDRFNETVQNVNAFKSDIVSEMEGYRDEKPEKWLESKKGELYQSWINEWEYLDLEEIEIEQPTIETPDSDLVDSSVLDNLPDEP